jgi:hypothetical protein
LLSIANGAYARGTMQSVLRVGVILVGVAVAAGSATSPGKPRPIQRTVPTPLAFEAAWASLIDLFADQGWAISQLSKESGLIMTDWMLVDDRDELFADCGGAAFRNQATQLRLNVRVKPVNATTEVTANVQFRQRRASETTGFIDCPSRGVVERMIHGHLTGGSGTENLAVPNPDNDPARAVAYWCSQGDGMCSADESACTGPCRKTDTVWCAPFRSRTTTSIAYLCGTTPDACKALLDNPEHRSGRFGFGVCARKQASRRVSALPAPRPRPVAPPPAPPAAAAPRGFFCARSAASPAAGFCTRDKADCQRARDAAVAAVPDLDECRLVEAAFCHLVAGGERCAPTLEACTDRARAAPGAPAACAERR